MQNVFLHTSIKQQFVERRTSISGSDSRRQYSYKFYLHTFGEYSFVCKKFFIDTFQISNARIRTVVKSRRNIPLDKRGKMPGSSRKITGEQEKVALDHMNSYPTFESHCDWEQNSDWRYLSPELTIKKMHNAYLEQCRENKITSVVCRPTYRRLFRQNTNLRIHPLCKDTCPICDNLPRDISEETDQ